MKALSINILNGIKRFISVVGPGLNPVAPVIRKKTQWQKSISPEAPAEIKEKIDLALFQRKAYQGNYFVGPYAFFNPEFFDEFARRS